MSKNLWNLIDDQRAAVLKRANALRFNRNVYAAGDAIRFDNNLSLLCEAVAALTRTQDLIAEKFGTKKICNMTGHDGVDKIIWRASPGPTAYPVAVFDRPCTCRIFTTDGGGRYAAIWDKPDFEFNN